MRDVPIHVIDFEGSRESGILEYGVVTLRGMQVESSRTRLCGATGRIRDVDARHHGISEKLVGGEPPFSEDWDYFAGLRESGLLCAHNAAVEDGLLRSVWPYPRASPDFASAGGPVLSWGPWLDTLQLYRRFYPDLQSHKLGDLVKGFGLAGSLAEWAAQCPEKRSRYHCALYDSFASALLLLKLFGDPALKDRSLHGWLIESTASGSARESMRQQDLF